MGRRLTNEQVKSFIESHNYRLLSEYVSASEKIKISCELNHVYDVKFNNFKQGKRCPVCSIEIRRSKLLLPIEEVKELFYKNNCQPLFNAYVNVDTPLDYICECGNISKIRIRDIKKGKRCKLCMGKKSSERYRHSYAYVSGVFQQNNCKLLSSEYINNKQKLDYVCSCGNISTIAFDKFKAGQRCSNCKSKKISQKTKGIPRPDWSGENHPGWKSDRTDEERLADRKFQEYHQWRKSVFVRDRYTCQCCSKVGYNLNAHHKDGWNWCIEKRLDVDNGVTLCSDCHKEFHSIYGKGNNTSQQFEEFYLDKLSVKRRN